MDEKDFSLPIKELCIRHYGREVSYCMRGTWETEFIAELQPKPEEIIIEDSVWIGLNCVILKGVKIGYGSVIGAGCIINRDIPPLSIVRGDSSENLRLNL